MKDGTRLLYAARMAAIHLKNASNRTRKSKPEPQKTNRLRRSSGEKQDPPLAVSPLKSSEVHWNQTHRSNSYPRKAEWAMAVQDLLGRGSSRGLFGQCHCPGFSVAGNVLPDMPKPLLRTATELITSAAVPEEVGFSALVEVVLRLTSSKSKLSALTES
jgi:hypothetical protein